MQTSELDFKLLYASIEALKQSASFTYKQMDLPHDKMKRLVEHSREYSYVSHNAASSVLGLNSTSSKILISHFSHCVHEIHKTRKMLREFENKSRLDEARHESKSNSYRAFTAAFPSATVETSCEVGGQVHCLPLYNKWDSLVEGGADVMVPISWNKKIYEEGISVVQAGDGARFILDCKERKIKRLNEEYIRCWAVRSVKRKHKICTVENAILMKYDAGGEVVLSISDNWAKAESLIRRRKKDSTLDVLMGL